jgi:Putative lumazine-binding
VPRRPLARLVCALTCALALAGCGKSDRAQVRGTVGAFRRATADRDYARICKDVLARQLVARLDQLGLPCERALTRYLVDTRQPRIVVRRVQVKGKRATAYVTSSAEGQRASRDRLLLVQENGGWRIASLGAGD